MYIICMGAHRNKYHKISLDFFGHFELRHLVDVGDTEPLINGEIW